MTRPVAPLPPAKADRMPLNLDPRAAVDMGMALAAVANALEESITPGGSRRKRDHLARVALHELRAIERRLVMIGTMDERKAIYHAWEFIAPPPQSDISHPQGES